MVGSRICVWVFALELFSIESVFKKRFSVKSSNLKFIVFCCVKESFHLIFVHGTVKNSWKNDLKSKHAAAIWIGYILKNMFDLAFT